MIVVVVVVVVVVVASAIATSAWHGDPCALGFMGKLLFPLSPFFQALYQPVNMKKCRLLWSQFCVHIFESDFMFLWPAQKCLHPSCAILGKGHNLC